MSALQRLLRLYSEWGKPDRAAELRAKTQTDDAIPRAETQ